MAAPAPPGTAAIPDRFAASVDALHEAAIAMTGHTDFGDRFYRTGLTTLLDAMDAECPFTPDGRRFAFFEVALTLAARLSTQAGWTARPELLTDPIRAPLVVTGLPRSCTTTLHRLLAVDPQFQGLESWIAQAPMPRPPRDSWEATRAFEVSAARLDRWFAAVPQFRAIHDMAAGDLEECIEVLRQDFVTNRFGCNFEVPSYDRWWMAQDAAPAYRRYADVLRLIAGGDRRCWLLKNPGHIYDIDALLGVFPDARVIYTHRYPLKAIPSIASLIHVAHQIPSGAAADPVTGPRELAVWSRGTQAMRRARATRPGQFHDVQFRDFMADPLAVVARIYDAFGLLLTAETEAAMRSWMAANPQGRHGEHRYTLAAHGLTDASVAAAFADYTEAYGPF